MATETRTPNAAMKAELLANGDKYGYFQAVRLLQLFDRGSGIRHDTPRVRPKLGLDFPETDIDCIEALPQGGHRIVANFFGLYGVASPLPTYYTEDLFAEAREGRHATREFLDIVHYAIYPLLFDAWSKYRLEQRIVEGEDVRALGYFYSFVGLGDADARAEMLPGSALLLRYAALLNQRPRSALGLRTMLADMYHAAEVDIECCVVDKVQIPDEQLCRLGIGGHQLGEAAYLGSQVDDYANRVCIRFSNVPQTLFHRLLPGCAGYDQLRFMIRFYLIDPLIVDIEMCLRHDDARGACLGGGTWSSLGVDTSLNPGHADLPMRVQFRL